MASENKKAESLCKNMSGLCGASCAFLSLEPDIKLSCVGEDWLCSRYCGCDYCNTLHYGCSEAYRRNGKYVFYCPKGLVFIAGKAVTLELSTSEFFMDNYVEHMMFM